MQTTTKLLSAEMDITEGRTHQSKKKAKKRGGGGKEKDITEGRELPVPACLVLEPSSLI